jgi:hypothetical protein
MPAGFDKERPFTGINTRIAVKGDFEIIVSYEIIKEPEVVVADKPSMKLILMAVLDRKQFNPATLTRLQLPDGEARYATYVTLTDKDTGQTKTKGANHFPAQAKSGKLRLVRKGTVLSAFVAEDPDPNFRFLKEFPNYPDEDLKYVRVLANTGNAKAAIDVRYHDLRIRWGALENAAANAPDAAAQEAFPKTASSKAWLMAGLVIGGTILLGIASALVAAWLYVRRAVVSQGALRDPGL